MGNITQGFCRARFPFSLFSPVFLYFVFFILFIYLFFFFGGGGWGLQFSGLFLGSGLYYFRGAFLLQKAKFLFKDMGNKCLSVVIISVYGEKVNLISKQKNRKTI